MRHDKAIEDNEIPRHLLPFIAKQDPTLYTAIDHASWRYILRVSKAFFAEHAHQKYLDGLEETGISLERIPLISEMDARLRRFGWRAVAVVGFIPPAVFMEFQSLGILPIACDMRRLEHLAYTPAPDIVHEAAGHAPIIADPEYAAYLRRFGEISRMAIFSSRDQELYEAIRELSDIKEDPSTTDEEVSRAEQRLEKIKASIDYVSEATELSRLGWWTFEYGLVGDLKDPKIYGAGLLSSVGESYHCLGSEVRKIPFSPDCIETNYDITKPQPQLFVAKDFGQLTHALEKVADSMAFRRGGMEALGRALKAQALTTTVLDSGIEISGVLNEVLRDARSEAAYLKYQGPVQLALREKEIEGQGPKYHAQGFSTALGRLKGSGKSPADLSETELSSLGVLEFESGVKVQGRLKSKLRFESRHLILTFENCTVKWGDKVLFQPDWGVFDLACGEKVVSVFGGAADRVKYLEATGGFNQKPGKQKTNLTDENRELCELYAQVRKLRERGASEEQVFAKIGKVLDEKYPHDWLLRLEILELTGDKSLRAKLESLAKGSLEKQEMIKRGLELLA